ncbi:glycosyltransferase family 4 protein [Butyrivibrio fibrisolvens]|uniref:glycosyltransferase family 4 protein n=1 Tax=Butyrivibrio fibrisolvens TaxID=831 RepID=UPI00040AEC61|nr:glycosyltransferase family 4 protein [Butyrivibrio fibrisolvens]
MKILMLVNWKIKYCSAAPDDLQSPDYYVKGMPYWFFKYMPSDVEVDVIDIRSFKWLENFERNKIRFYIWQTIKALPRLKNYDLVISHGMQSGIVLAIIRRLFGKGRYKHLVFDIGAFNSARESGRSLKLMQYASRSIDAVIYHTRSQVDYYKKCHPWLLDKSIFIPFGTDYDYFVRDIPEVIHRNQNIRDYILCVGYNKRDWATLAMAYSKIDTDVRLVMVGHVDDKIRDIDPRIIMIPKVPVEELRCWIKDALFCVLPLEYMNYSFGQMTLLQQMAMGKAVITADVPSIEAYKMCYYDPDNRRDDNMKGMDDIANNMLIYESGNVLDLKDKIEYLMSDPKLIDTIGCNANDSVKNNFNEQIMAKSIWKYIKEVMNEGI